MTGAIGLDVGSSTGGFTDVLLSRGAAKVYAVDVGTNQLAWKLRQDPRVVVQEQTNARYLGGAGAGTRRYRGLRRELHIACEGARSAAEAREAGREAGRAGQAAVRGGPRGSREGRGGPGPCRFTSGSAHEAKVWVEEQGWTVLGVVQSPITGPEGNIEFLLGAEKNG